MAAAKEIRSYTECGVGPNTTLQNEKEKKQEMVPNGAKNA